MRKRKSWRADRSAERLGIAMIVEAASPLELDGIFEDLPVWPLMETSVTPLTTFEDRIRAISPRLERDKADAHK